MSSSAPRYSAPPQPKIRAALLGATAAEDPRCAVDTELAGDRDPSVRRTAVAALR